MKHFGYQKFEVNTSGVCIQIYILRQEAQHFKKDVKSDHLEKNEIANLYHLIKEY